MVLLEGVISVSQSLDDERQQIVDFLLPGDVLLHPDAERSHMQVIEATTDIELCAFGAGDIGRAGIDEPEWNRSLLEVALREIGRKNDHIMLIGRKRADERIASFLLDLVERERVSGRAGRRLSLRMARAAIADYLCLTTETVSRVFTALRREGLIQLPRPGEVVVVDEERLAGVASGAAQIAVR